MLEKLTLDGQLTSFTLDEALISLACKCKNTGSHLWHVKANINWKHHLNFLQILNKNCGANKKDYK